MSPAFTAFIIFCVDLLPKHNKFASESTPAEVTHGRVITGISRPGGFTIRTNQYGSFMSIL